MTVSLALGLSLSVALAEPGAPVLSDQVIHVTAEPSDVVALYREAALEAGLSGAALLPACRKWSEHFFMCFMVQEEAGQRIVHMGDLEDWGTSPVELEERAREVGRAVLEEERARRVEVEGIATPYWVFERGDGVDASALLFPAELGERLGGAPVFAVPSRGLVIAWIPGDRELDQVVAVGVSRIHGESVQPISPVVVRWTGTGWARWGEALAMP